MSGGGEKTEQPTEKRLRDARRKGQVAKSHDLSSAVLLVAAVVVLWVASGYMGGWLSRSVTEQLNFASSFKGDLDERVALGALGAGAKSLLLALAPLFGALVVVAVLVNYFQVGSIFSFEPVKTNANKLNPAEGFNQRFLHRKELRMTKHEVREEYKETEGNPLHKSLRRQMHREILLQSVMEAVRRASVVVRNPTHLAVAIRYERGETNAPVVVAKGAELLAARIRELAKESGVPVTRDVPLARALYELEIDEEVPEELYESVAVVLRWVYQLAEERGGGGRAGERGGGGRGAWREGGKRKRKPPPKRPGGGAEVTPVNQSAARAENLPAPVG